MELQKLKALAEEAKEWSSCNQAWLDESGYPPFAVVGHISETGYLYPVALIEGDSQCTTQDALKLAQFYAAATPETVLKLIGMVETQPAEIQPAEIQPAEIHV